MHYIAVALFIGFCWTLTALIKGIWPERHNRDG